MRLIILGAGGFGRTIADIAEQSGEYEKIEFLDDNVIGSHVIARLSDLEAFVNNNDADSAFYCAIGDNILRCELIERIQSFGGNVVSIIHRASYVSPTVKLGAGVAILPHASIGTSVRIGTGCIINMNAIVDHDTNLEDGVHIAPGAIVKGENRISKYTKIDSGMVIERGYLK